MPLTGRGRKVGSVAADARNAAGMLQRRALAGRAQVLPDYAPVPRLRPPRRAMAVRKNQPALGAVCTHIPQRARAVAARLDREGDSAAVGRPCRPRKSPRLREDFQFRSIGAFAIPRIPARAHLQSNQLLRADYMTPDERAQLIEDIRRSTASRERIVERASADKEFDIAAAWETVEELDRSIYTRILRARSK